MTQVLQVDRAYRPLGFVNPFRAFSMVWEDKATVLEEDPDNFLRSPSIQVNVPLVIQIPHVVRLRPLKDNVIIRRVVYARDEWECQYCSEPITMRSATIDHVKPKVYFVNEGRPVSDANTWDNVVTSCARCNHRKGGRLPYECGMMPKNTPKKPDYVQTLWIGRKYLPIHAKYVLQYYPSLKGDLEIDEGDE